MAEKKDNKKETIHTYLADMGSSDTTKNFNKKLKENDFNLDLLDNEGKTALMFCIKNNLPDKIWSLLEFFADPNVQDLEGKTALHYAVDENHKEYQLALLFFNADPNIEDNNKKRPYQDKEDILEELTVFINEFKKTFCFMTRKRRKYLRYIYNIMDQNNKVITSSDICRYLTEYYAPLVDDMKAMDDANLFIEQALKYKLDLSDKSSLNFEEFLLCMLKIAKVKGMKTVDEFIDRYKEKKYEDKIREQQKKEKEAQKKKEES